MKLFILWWIDFKIILSKSFWLKSYYSKYYWIILFDMNFELLPLIISAPSENDSFISYCKYWNNLLIYVFLVT